MEYVLIETKDFITTITINRPKALNALNADVLKDLNEAIDMIDINTTRCVIVTGSGEKSFVAGADIKQMLNQTPFEAKDFALYASKVFRKLETLSVPTIAAVNGFALGGGMELAMACDMRIASENALFGQPEVGLGIIPGFGGTQRLPRLISEGMANELILSGRKIKAAQAKEIGLVNHVYPLESLMAEANKLASMIANNAPIGVRTAKEAVQKGIQCDIDTGLAIEANMFFHCFTTEDRINAMESFVNKSEAKPFINK